VTAVLPERGPRVELPARELTLDDVAALAAVDSVHRYELIDGGLLIMPPADVDHARAILRLAMWLINRGYSEGLVLLTPGLRITLRTGGRSPDLLVLRRPVPGDTVWVDPADALLAIEVVSPGSQTEDRLRKPIEYASVGIEHFWRVERTGGAATVHMFTLGVNDRGEPAYFPRHAVLLDELLAGEPPAL
jgi:Uma2 family endonuclease